MTQTDEFGPDNPREWTTETDTLSEEQMLKAPHETAGILRMQRNGIHGKDIMRLLRRKGQQVMLDLRDAMDAESDAIEADVPIHDPIIRKEKL
ncbi:hypothetical protein SEA_STROSAHL_81 [Gordonia phage Strosahl]|uniref:Gp68-like predicted RNA polymerase component domain-containing protein n=5 Tax=Soupsvirus TaxID=1982562 RepID=A0A166YEG2_9CAUD|nr:hypothetical protein BEN61_gp033 [Gordonia phage Rosalind]YP_009269100.1 hypothetical protein BEN62_gp030 [Gordonia phage KatherineG]YP_009269378.1 hypothetical protein BEN59_gp031 [Gordonia phage Soups]YP_009281692.1 hypothetical protein BIZ67_gp029 [Gordonia phage Remus]YP_009286020.1 hypothetical protein BIZ70_gp034 [Gordonia phage JSwag]YP_009596282.1 hypothetical protein FDH03_gp029 [Gordonia phage Strosahl]YP_009624595.1 hypothetical protein FDJ48_gp030 [Gordonia phage Waits]AXH4787